MAASRSLRRLLRVLDLEEEQRRAALESAQSELGRLEHASEAAAVRQRAGRRMVTASVESGRHSDRLAGMAETSAAEHRATLLAPKIAGAEEQVVERRGEYLAKRVERRQAETLVRAAEAEDAIASDRRTQQSLDNLFLNGLFRKSQLRSRKKRGS